MVTQRFGKSIKTKYIDGGVSLARLASSPDPGPKSAASGGLCFYAAPVLCNPRIGIGGAFERTDLGWVTIRDVHLYAECPVLVRDDVIGRFGMRVCRLAGGRHDSLNIGQPESARPDEWSAAIVSHTKGMDHPRPSLGLSPAACCCDCSGALHRGWRGGWRRDTR
jgi:hypothetical protein